MTISGAPKHPQQRPRLVQGCDWEATSSLSTGRNKNVLCLDWDDGHVPENLDAISHPTQLVKDAYYHSHCSVHVVDNTVHSSLLQALYDTTVQNNNKDGTKKLRPWGTYVSIQQLHDAFGGRSDNEHNNNNHNNGHDKVDWLLSDFDPRQPLEDAKYSRDELALRCVAAYLHHVLKTAADSKMVASASSAAATTTRGPSPMLPHYGSFDYLSTSKLLTQDAHGVAVWALASEPGSQVPYHLDYAEQVRYESNVIVPPILSGTLQCTPAVIKGGAYCVHTDGLSHYEKHGYKCNKSRQHAEALLEERAIDSATTANGWIQIPFRTNRMILQSGHLPHLSTTVESVEPSAAKRVIVGFNVFGHNVGPFVQRAPEHSDTFRRKVALQRLVLLKTKNNTSTGAISDKKLSVQAILSNPWLSKLLVRAKRQKAKDDFLQAQADLDQRIESFLFLSSSSSACHHPRSTTAQALVDELGRSDGSWPNADDVLVHLERRCREGRWRILATTTTSSSDDRDQQDAAIENKHLRCVVTPNSRIGLATRAIALPNN